MDYAALRSLKPSQFEDAADGYRKVGEMARRAKDDVEQQITAKMRKSLEGEAVDAALGQLRGLAKNFHYVQVECGLVSTALNAFAADVRPARKKLDAAVEEARARKFTVESDGSVSYPAAGEKTGGRTPQGGTATGAASEQARAVNRQAAGFDPNPHYVHAQECADRIAEALRDATEADLRWAPKLRALKADDDLTVSHGDWADTHDDMAGVRKGAGDYLDGVKAPPEEGTPKENAEWWNKLSRQEQADYVSLQPASVGALDGLPAEVRDEANRTVLAEKRGQYGMRLQAIPAEPAKYVPFRDAVPGQAYSADWLAWNEKYGDRKRNLQSVLNGMDAIQKRFDSTGRNGMPAAYLLGFDPEGKGDGKVILATGNPDTADHTAVYVPGTGTNLGVIDGDLNRSETLWRESNKMSPDDKVSTITWFDYDAPNEIPSAVQSQYAERGGPDLRQFLDGNRVAHQGATGDAAHTTAIGHSYGSTLIGDAAQAGTFTDGLLAVDDVVVAGSPGMQADHAADLGIDPDHMWAMSGGGDDWYVREGGRLVGLGDGWTVPTDESFGGRVMRSDAEDHSAFWNEDSISLMNQAAVVTGNYDRAEIE